MIADWCVRAYIYGYIAYGQVKLGIWIDRTSGFYNERCDSNQYLTAEHSHCRADQIGRFGAQLLPPFSFYRR